MNKKIQYEILLIILVFIVIINLSFIILQLDSNPKNTYNITEVGRNVNGTVYKVIAGNTSSNETVGLILGVHPREHEIHEQINESIYNITSPEGSKNLTKRYVIYYIKTVDNLTSHDETRDAGEELANKYVVPNIVKDNPFIVLDVHEIDPEYEYSDFIFPLSNRSDEINSYMSKLCSDVGLEDYDFTLGTSPEKVTIPIANNKINTMLMETNTTGTITQKHETAEKLIESLDSLGA